MEKFLYTAYDSAGAKHEGELSALNLDSAKFKLKEQGLLAVKIGTAHSTARGLKYFFQFNRKPRLADVEFFTSQLSLLLNNGIKIDRALGTAKNGITNSRLKRTVDEIYDDVRRGEHLSQAMEKHQDIFDSLYVSIVRIGEATGKLGEVFADLAANLDFRQKVISKTRQAMIYPAVILAVCLMAIVFIFNFIVPRFSVVFSSMERAPIYTRVLLNFGLLFQRFQFVFLAVAVAAALLMTRVKGQDRFRRWRDLLVLRLAVTRRLCHTLENLRFSSSLAILLKSGVVLSEALEYAVQSIGNVLIRRRVVTVKEAVRAGKRLSEALGKTGFLTEAFLGLIEVGEHTGSLAAVFSEMERRLKTQYEERVETLVTLIEPALIIFMGLIVGTVVVTMLLSMVSISDIQF
jgi:type II secretory pathway component PulF